MRVEKIVKKVVEWGKGRKGHIAPCRRSRRASTTGVGMSTASALAWMASMCGCRYDREASAFHARGLA